MNRPSQERQQCCLHRGAGVFPFPTTTSVLPNENTYLTCEDETNYLTPITESTAYCTKDLVPGSIKPRYFKEIFNRAECKSTLVPGNFIQANSDYCNLKSNSAHSVLESGTMQEEINSSNSEDYEVDEAFKMALNVHEEVQKEEECCLQQLNYEDCELQLTSRHIHKLEYETMILEEGSAIPHPAKKNTNIRVPV